MMVIFRGPIVSIYLPVNGIAIAKNARNTENGSRTSFAVTVCPSVPLKYSVSGVTNTLQE